MNPRLDPNRLLSLRHNPSPGPLRAISRLAAALPLAVLAAACAGMRAAAPAAPSPAAAPESYTLTGAAVAIDNPAGAVRVESGSGPDVRVTVTRFGTGADQLRVDHQADALRITVDGPASRRLLYPNMPGRSDSVEFRATRSGFAAGRGGFLGLFGGRSMKVVRNPGKPRSTDAHADVVVSVPAGRRVDVHVGVGEIRVAGSVGDLAVQNLTGATELDSAGGRIRVTSASGGVFVRNGNGELAVIGGSSSVNLAGFTGLRLEVTTGAGSIRGTSVSAGVTRLRAGAGAIEIAGLHGGYADLGTGSGRVVARDVVIDTLLATSGVGDVSLLDLRAGTATVRSRKGDISLGLITVPATLLVRADGAARILLPTGAGAELAATSAHGRVRLERDPAAGIPTTAAGRSVTLRLGGGGGRVEVRAEHDVVIGVGLAPAEAALR